MNEQLQAFITACQSGSLADVERTRSAYLQSDPGQDLFKAYLAGSPPGTPSNVEPDQPDEAALQQFEENIGLRPRATQKASGLTTLSKPSGLSADEIPDEAWAAFERSLGLKRS